MSNFSINVHKITDSSKDIINIAQKLKTITSRLEYIKSEGILDSTYKNSMNTILKNIITNISDEAVKMDSMGKALEYIADEYKKTEKTIINTEITFGAIGITENWYEEYRDWIESREPDAYTATTIEQEKAADNAMKKVIWNIIQNEKYSQENWDKSSINERKQILQDYMNELIQVYGLQNVKSEIVWDDKATYTKNSITWGSYNHSKHIVKLNVNALADSIGIWDSYELLGTVSHELRHAYQHEAVDNPNNYMVSKETINSWATNFDNYISSSKDYAKYREQVVEVDARDFEINRDDKISV